MAYSLSSTSLLSPSPSPLSSNSKAALSFYSSHSHFRRPTRLFLGVQLQTGSIKTPKFKKAKLIRCAAKEPLKVMISGAPASGKGTQCQMIAQKFGVVHISTGDLLRAEVAAGTEIGNKAKDYMNSGRLVPDEIVTAMVATRLSLEDAKEKGWLLDGYPRSAEQAHSLEKMGVRPDLYIILEVADDILIDRCVGRRLDPLTGKIYHITNFPPETEEIRARLITRPDDTEEKAKSRLEIYKRNAEVVSSIYNDILNKIDGNRSKDSVFEEVSILLDQKRVAKSNADKSLVKSKNSNPASQSQDKWRGIPTRLNNIPHSREIREIGSLMELVRVLALSFADDGKHVKVCVQGSMGEGSLAGMPLQLAGTRKILEYMDWGEYGAMGTFVNIGSIGASEVEEQDDMFILVAPQNAVGNCIIDDLRAMTDAAGNRPVILVNPRLKDLPGSSGIMQTMGRDKRLEYAASFESCYAFRLLYYAGTQYPIMGALRMSYSYGYELYKRVDESPGREKYVLLSTFQKKPSGDEINDAFLYKPSDKVKPSGFWGFLSGILT
ncbi:hypothetical protein V2J09_018779 [Rumex salicifolius]